MSRISKNAPEFIDSLTENHLTFSSVVVHFDISNHFTI
jgi:hypothetical protein